MHYCHKQLEQLFSRLLPAVSLGLTREVTLQRLCFAHLPIVKATDSTVAIFSLSIIDQYSP